MFDRLYASCVFLCNLLIIFYMFVVVTLVSYINKKKIYHYVCPYLPVGDGVQFYLEHGCSSIMAGQTIEMGCTIIFLRDMFVSLKVLNSRRIILYEI